MSCAGVSAGEEGEDGGTFNTINTYVVFKSNNNLRNYAVVAYGLRY